MAQFRKTMSFTAHRGHTQYIVTAFCPETGAAYEEKLLKLIAQGAEAADSYENEKSTDEEVS